ARSDFTDNWTIGLQVSMPIFDGGRIRGTVVQARGALEQARGRLLQTREAAARDTRDKLETLAAARAALEAATQTVLEAQRAYQIGQVRYREGLSPLTEVSEARLALAQAQA